MSGSLTHPSNFQVSRGTRLGVNKQSFLGLNDCMPQIGNQADLHVVAISSSVPGSSLLQLCYFAALLQPLAWVHCPLSTFRPGKFLQCMSMNGKQLFCSPCTSYTGSDIAHEFHNHVTLTGHTTKGLKDVCRVQCVNGYDLNFKSSKPVSAFTPHCPIAESFLSSFLYRAESAAARSR